MLSLSVLCFISLLLIQSGDNIDAQKLGARFTYALTFFPFRYLVIRTYIEASGPQKLPDRRKYNILYILSIHNIYNIVFISFSCFS